MSFVAYIFTVRSPHVLHESCTGHSGWSPSPTFTSSKGLCCQLLSLWINSPTTTPYTMRTSTTKPRWSWRHWQRRQRSPRGSSAIDNCLRWSPLDVCTQTLLHIASPVSVCAREKCIVCRLTKSCTHMDMCVHDRHVCVKQYNKCIAWHIQQCQCVLVLSMYCPCRSSRLLLIVFVWRIGETDVSPRWCNVKALCGLVQDIINVVVLFLTELSANRWSVLLYVSISTVHLLSLTPEIHYIHFPVAST